MDTDKICHACHAKYTEIIGIHNVLGTIDIQGDDQGLISLNADLDMLIANLKHEVQHTEQGSERSALITTKIMVAETLRNQKAIMLPSVSDFFKSAITDKKCTRTTRWSQRQLEETMGHHMKFTCKHRKYGTILYRAGGDMLNALSFDWHTAAITGAEQQCAKAVVLPDFFCVIV